MARAGGDFDPRDGRSATPVYDQMIAEFGDPSIPPIALSIPPFYPERDRYSDRYSDRYPEGDRYSERLAYSERVSASGQAAVNLPVPQQWGDQQRVW